jgi:hypothetical protein
MIASTATPTLLYGRLYLAVLYERIHAKYKAVAELTQHCVTVGTLNLFRIFTEFTISTCATVGIYAASIIDLRPI